jgi:hypothetical protein
MAWLDLLCRRKFSNNQPFVGGYDKGHGGMTIVADENRVELVPYK